MKTTSGVSGGAADDMTMANNGLHHDLDTDGTKTGDAVNMEASALQASSPGSEDTHHPLDDNSLLDEGRIGQVHINGSVSIHHHPDEVALDEGEGKVAPTGPGRPPTISVHTIEDAGDRELPPPLAEALTENGLAHHAPNVQRPTSQDAPSELGVSSDGSRSRSPSAVNVHALPKPPSLSSMVFVVSALESIVASKEARKRKQLGDATQKALTAIKEAGAQLPDPEVIFLPLQLATMTGNVPLTNTALDCIGKLISYSYFAVPYSSAPRPGEGVDSALPLIERAIDTIVDCFQGEATPNEIQLQIVKSLLAAVLNDKIVVHGAGLLKAVRQTYNIFLLSKSSANQQIAQGTLTQMIGTVFERLKYRLATKEARLDLSRPSGKMSDAHSLAPSDVHHPMASKDDVDDGPDAVDSPSMPRSNGQVAKEAVEKITLQSFENRKSFDDERIDDNAPTMVTRAPMIPSDSQQIPDLPPPRLSSRDRRDSEDPPDDDEEDEIYIKDAFLVFRAMCKLSIKTLAPEQLLDVKSHGMRSKLLSLHLVHTSLKNNLIVFTSPLATIRGSNSDEPSSFLQATKQYLCLSLSRNGASSVTRVFEVCCEIFWLMLKNLRVMLKKEIEVFLKEIYLAILDRRNTPAAQKQYLINVLQRLSADPRALVEIYLNYDCDRAALDNMFQRIIEHLSRLSSTAVLVTPIQQQHYQDIRRTRMHLVSDAPDTGALPPSLATANVTEALDLDTTIPIDYSIKQQSLGCLVATLRSLVDWSQQGLADANAKGREQGSQPASEKHRDSLDTPSIATGVSTPRLLSAEAPGESMPLDHPLDDDPSQLEIAKQQKTALLSGIRQFNFKPKRGIKHLIKEGFIASSSPEDIATFLLRNPGLDKAMLGDYLGDGEPENVAVMHAFVDLMDFRKTRFVDALRRFLQSFRLPGEAQKIDRFMLKFAERYISGNPNAFANADTAYVLAYSVIMLNTDQHSSKIKGGRMTREDFIKNNRGINDNADLPDEYLSGIFDEIAHDEIVLLTERNATAATSNVQPSNAGLAANIGQAFSTVGRDLQREAYVQATQEMATKTEQLFRNLLRTQRRSSTKLGVTRFIPATSFRHVGPMFEVTWMSFLSAFASQVQDTQHQDTIKLCMEGFQLAIRICCLFELDTPRVAFVSTLAKFTNLGNLQEMTAKNVEALKVLLDIAQTEGDLLKSSWKEILTCISQLDRFQLISSGVDEGSVPDMLKAGILTSPRTESSTYSRPMSASRRPRPRTQTSSTSYLSAVAQESRSSEIIKAVDRIFTGTARLSGDAIVHFVRALSQVSWQEIQSSGQLESPRTFSLQKVVEISYYNMTRVRFEWSAVWQVLGEHFNQVGCHTNTSVVFMALDSLRQLSMRFMEFEELSGFKFQKDFLKPFEHVMANSSVVTVKDMVLRCLIQMIQARGDNIRSGWKTMFGVFTVAARELFEGIVNLAFDNVHQIYNTRFGMVISQGAFADLVVCLTEFSKNMKFQKRSLQAIDTIKSTIPRMRRTPECPLSKGFPLKNPSHESPGERSPMRTIQEEQYWFPVLFAFHNVLMTGEDLEVRSRALSYLFEALLDYGNGFSSEFWDILWRQLLYPIFMVLKSKSELVQAMNHEELSVWLSTTMIQALRNMIALFTHYFGSLKYMLDRFLDLLTLCICQENDTIARIGSNCLQQLILQNVNKFDHQHWTKIVGAFVELFERTTAYQLFTAVSDMNAGTSAVVSGGEMTPKGSQQDEKSIILGNNPPIDEVLPELKSPNSLRINGLPPTEGDDPAITASAPEEPSQRQPEKQQQQHLRRGSRVSNDLEDYRPQSELQQQPVVVTAARRRFFNKIITKCVLQLLMIETVSELFSNDAVYAQIPSSELLRLMMVLRRSFLFARKFNGDKELRWRLWKEGFMKQPPNLLKQESGSAATYVSILLRMYHDEGEERKKSRDETEDALIPLGVDIIRGYILLDEDSQQRNILAWRPVVVDVLEGYTHFPTAGFEKYIQIFYPLAVDLLRRELGSDDVRLALQALLRRVGHLRIDNTNPARITTTATNTNSSSSAMARSSSSSFSSSSSPSLPIV